VIKEEKKHTNGKSFCDKNCLGAWKSEAVGTVEHNSTGRKVSDEWRQTHSERMSGQNHPFYGQSRPAHSERMKGEDNPNWIPGPNPKSRGVNWDEQRKKSLERDEYLCCVCNNEAEVVHHIVAFRDFNNYEEANKLQNLMSLCRSCHSYIENRIRIEQLTAEEQKAIANKAINKGKEVIA